MRDLPENWLVFRLSALGDVVLTTGAMRYWHERYGWRFHVLTRDVFAPVLEHNPAVEKVVTPAPDDLHLPRLAAWFSGLASEYAGWGLLDMHGTFRSRVLALSWKGPVRRYPKHICARRLFLLSGGKLCGETLRAVTVPQRYALAVESAPPEASELLPVMYLQEEERRWGKSFLANLFGDDVLKNAVGCVAIHPFAAHRHKAWPTERFVGLLAALDAKNIPWVLLGRGEALFSGNDRDLINTTDIRQTAAIVASCSALVTADSGPMHLATAVGTPVVALFGPTTREWGFFPSGVRDRVLERDIACRPCSLHGKKPCPRGGECLAAILPDEVMAALEELWSAACNTDIFLRKR